MNLEELTSQLSAHNADHKAIAEQILAADIDGPEKAVKAIKQHCQEVVHYASQLAAADTVQWQQSFAYELQQSLKALNRALKKLQN